ncbi:GNAT family N-acetyltransferase [Streptococcus caballi]|uniref:GNAT family N-acetyltransferase n=1 Tax=Streptococcus caballi TaxID=439220 RepID=UPI000366A27D|nr:GNAT family N-acetyltransferase [Streptococcus caballi]
MQIKQTRNTLSDTYLDAVRIRQKVFVQEQGVPRHIEIDKNEALCLHFVLYDDNDKAAATCRILPNAGHTKATLQRMAVLSDYRGQHLGALLLEEVVNFCQKQGFKTIELHAQLSAFAFYQKLSFRPVGQQFTEAGIEHITMKKEL